MKVLTALLATVLLVIIRSSMAAESLQRISLEEWENRLVGYRSNIVVVDYWATWCSSCLERFPRMVELQKKFALRNVQFVGLNLDDPNDEGSIRLAEQFLDKVDADFPQYHITDNLMESFEHLDLLGIPAVSIMDREGNEILRLTGDNPDDQFTDKDIEKGLLQALER